MQHMNTLLQVVNAASSVAEVVRTAQTHRFNVGAAPTLYVDTKGAEVRVCRRPLPYIEVESRLQAAFGWRIVSDQDDAGVYFVARRRPVVGGVAGASFTLIVPMDTYLVLKLKQCRLYIEDADGTFELPPALAEDTPLLLPTPHA